MKPKFWISIAAALAFIVLASWWYLSEYQPAAQLDQQTSAEQQANNEKEAQSVEQLLQKFKEVKKDGKAQAADVVAETVQNDTVISPEDEPVNTNAAEHEVNIGPLVHPELDDPNLGVPPSEPQEIGELLDPETYLPPAPANEKEINIGPQLPAPGDEPLTDTVEEKPVELGKPIDAAAEPIED